MTCEWSAVGTVRANGVRIGYREAGDPAGAPVLLLHGSSSNTRTWDRFAAQLTAAGHRAVAVDLRGHATSARTTDYALTSIRDDVLGLLDVMDLRDVTLIGHSVGGYAALAAALHTPGRITRLVLEDLAAPPRRAVLFNGTGPRQLLAAAATVAITRRDYELRAVRSIFRQLSHPDPGWWAQLGEVRQPTLILSGGPSSLIPPRRLVDVAASIPGARFTTIPVGHRVHSLAPDRFTAEVITFLDDQVVGAGTAEASRTA